MSTVRIYARSFACAFLVCVTLSETSCKTLIPEDSVLVALSMKDAPPPPKPVPPPPPPLYTVDIVVDTGSAPGAKANVEQVVTAAVEFVAAQDPGSDVRLWVLGESDAQLLSNQASSQSGWVVATDTAHRSPDVNLRIQRMLTAYSSARRSSANPLAEALTKVSLAPPSDRSHWLLLILSDGVEQRSQCRSPGYQLSRPCQPAFNCTPPAKAEWLKYLDQQRLLQGGALKGAAITFAYFEPSAEHRCCDEPPCLGSMAYAQALQDLWRAALAERAGGNVTFELRAPTFPKISAEMGSSALAGKGVK